MPLFTVVVTGRGHWISVDDEIQRVQFRVTRVVEATDADQAAQQALELVGADRRATPLPGYAAPSLSVEGVTPAPSLPDPQPGFAFFPDPE